MTDTPVSLGDRYELGEVLGRGGMAEVHVGRDVRLGRRVAIKMLRSDLARDPSFQARFRREAQSAASLNHSSIVAVYDTGEDLLGDDSVPYIVMEYVDGSTLRDLLKSGRRLLPERALEITAGVLDALDYSHRHGIVHRDIKPANVMLTLGGAVKVMDFGIARAVADASATMTQTSAVIGTAQYLSPEQARGETVDARSDLYSTGCLLYELLTGRPPFVGDSPVAVAYQHVREAPLPPSSIDPEVTPAADAITLKALAKDRDDRYQSAAEMRADIERALGGEAVEAAPTTQVVAPVAAPMPTTLIPAMDEPEKPEGRRRIWAYILLAFAVVGVFALAAWLGRELFSGSTANRVALPNVVGLTQQQATDELLQANVKVGQVENRSDELDKGVVLEQSPPANTRVDEGSSVNLVVSSGPDVTSVPFVVGQTYDQAVAALRAAGLQPGTRTEQNSDQDANQVLRAQPAEGSQVQRDSAVNLFVASGSNQVPNVVGLSLRDARARLLNAGFKVDADTGAEDRKVTAQSEAAGSSLRLGSTIALTVAPPPPTPTPTPTTPTPTPTTTPPTTPPATPASSSATSPSP